MTNRRTFVGLATLATLAMAALLPAVVEAQTPAARRYGVLSAIGDRLTVVAYQPTTGTRIDRNERWPVPMDSTALDDTALLAVRGGLPAATSAGTSFYRVTTDRFAQWQRLAETGDVQLPADVAASLQQDGVTHLVLVSKLRAPASVQLDDGRLGSGSLEGLGFYLDHGVEIRDRERGTVGKGFIAPYVYVQLSLIDVAAKRIVGREAVRVATGHSAAASTTGRDPWEALSADEKGRLIGEILTREVGSATGRLVAG